VTIDAVAKYLKIKAKDRADTPVEERRTAQGMLRRMEQEYPELKATADRVDAILKGSAPEPESWQGMLREILRDSATAVATDIGDALRHPERREPLRRGQVVLTRHTCGPDQVCLEIRARAQDVRGRRHQSAIFDAVEGELADMAFEIGG